MYFVISSLPMPVRVTPRSPMSDDALLRFCEANKGLQVEREPDGDLTIMTPATFGTSAMNLTVTRLLGNWAEEDGRGVSTGPDGGFTLSDGSMRSPDAAWISNEKVARLTAKQKDGFPPVCPEFVVELRSSGDRAGAVKTKMLQWIANGAEVGWLIDPKRRVVTVYRVGEAVEELVDPTSVQGTGPVRGFELVMGRVWG